MSTRSHHDLLYHVLAPAFLIFTAFISFLTYNNYSPFAPEVWICLVGLGMVAVLCGLVGIAGGWPVRVVMTAGLVVLFVDLQFNWFDEFNPWPELRVIGAFLLALFLSFALRRHLSRIVTAVFATLLISTIVLGAVDGGSLRDSGPATVAESGPAADPELPILVHFILDEHIGVEGIPDGVPHGKEMRAFLRDFFDRYGFRVFARAYSHYANTYNSLANLVNFSSEAADGAFTSGPEPYVVLRNEYFQLLGRKGYKIHVYQSDYMDFCSASKEYITRCANQEITGVEAIEAQDIPVSDKVRLIYRRFADLSALKSVAGAYYEHSRAALRSAGWTLPEWWFKEARLGPLPVMPVFDDVTMDVARASPGNMFFVYLAMPHFPYVYDSMCRLRPVSEWEWSRNPAPMPANDRQSRARRYGLYLEQMRCLYRKLDAMFEAWQKAAIFDELTIVIHSDHGSRINRLRPKAESREKLSHADYIDAFSTLFAVKGPRHPPGYDRRVAAIEQLLKEVVDQRSGDDHRDSEQIPYVFLVDRTDQALLRQPLPVFGDERKVAASAAGPIENGRASQAREFRRFGAGSPATILKVGEFGAQGNGGADDTAALQSAFDALENGDQLHFDADKIYTISRSLVLSDKSGYRVVGNNATIRMMDGVPATKSDPNFLLLIKDNHDFSWENLTIDGNRANRPGPAPESGDQAPYHNIIISGGSDFKFEQVQSNHSYQDGFYIAAPDAQDPSSFPRGAQFIECNALHNWRQGMSIINAYDVRVSGGSYSFTHGDWPMAGIDIEPNKPSAVPGVKGVAIQGVRFEANKGFGVAAASARPEDILIEHSYFRANARGGVRIGGANMTVQNNLFEDFNTAITYKAYGHFSTETRGIVDIAAGGGENRNARVIGNTFRSISVGSSIVYVHRIAGDGAEITDNCFEQYTVPAILSHKASSVQIARNEMNPPSGCLDPRKKTTEQPSDSPR